jgi:preprotein translocase subunit SecD
MSIEDVLRATFADHEDLAPNADELLDAVRRDALASPRRRHRRVLMLASAAAVVLLAVALTTLGLHRTASRTPAGQTQPPSTASQPAPSGSQTGAPGQALELTCISPSGAPVAADADVMTARASALGAHDVTVTTAGDTLRVTMAGPTASEASLLCGIHGALTVRSLVVTPVPNHCNQSGSPSCSGTSVTDAAASGGFPVPTDPSELDALTAQQRQQLRDALANFDCSTGNADDPSAPFTVACAPGSRYGLTSPAAAVLLGHSVTSSADITAATVSADNSEQSSVNVTLNGTGEQSLANYTNAHADPSATLSTIANCTTTTAPRCASYLVITDGTEVLNTLPVTQPTTGSSLVVLHRSETDTANTYAAALQGGPLPVPLTPQSENPVH